MLQSKDIGLPLPARLLFTGYLISAIGTGVVFPYLAIYIQQVRALGGAVAATALAVVALATIVGSLVVGPSERRAGARKVGSSALVLQALGYGLVGLSTSTIGIVLSCVLIGVGTGAFYATLTLAINLTCPPNQHRRAFAVRYMINNLGVGIGILASSFVVNNYNSARFAALYEVNALSYMILLVFFHVALSSKHSTQDAATSADPDMAAGKPRWRGMLTDRTFARLLAIETLLVIGGFGQFQSVIPLLLRVRLSVSSSLVAIVFIFNCFGIVVLQPVVTRLFSKAQEHLLLALMGAVWTFAFVIAIGTSFGGAVGFGSLVLFTIVFTIGESFYGSSFHPLVVKIAPKEYLGHYSSAVWSVWGAVSFIAPPLGVLIVDSRWPVLLWIVGVVCSAAVALCALTLPRQRDEPEVAS